MQIVSWDDGWFITSGFYDAMKIDSRPKVVSKVEKKMSLLRKKAAG
jgi:hypothetical protein